MPYQASQCIGSSVNAVRKLRGGFVERLPLHQLLAALIGLLRLVELLPVDGVRDLRGEGGGEEKKGGQKGACSIDDSRDFAQDSRSETPPGHEKGGPEGPPSCDDDYAVGARS